ncbi:MAG TPA: MiaB/RimO family radical SAM methylthiotransferase, partial [Phycisphaerae bacterium]|nr:MiaB/RimO family radical SAM methylthiotransferase [Phycisphaerae bacterium]
RVSKVDPCRGGIASDAGRFRLTPRHTAYLRIAEGCSQRCTFCTIPAIRGPFRSRPPEQVLAEAAALIADRAVELNIIAQDTTGYGRDLDPRTSPARLLRRLDRLDGVRWIRLMYAYPRRFTDALIAAVAACEHVVPYVDIPLQHISDPILRRMGRGITRATTEKLLRRIRDRIPGVVIRTALIVGFPGETDRHFEELLHFVREFRFGALGAFPFSPEDGTPAAELPDAVPPEIRRQRAETIMLAQQEIAFAANRGMIGRRVEVLVDGKDARGGCVGRYYGQAPEIDGTCRLDDDRPAGSFVRGTVVDCDAYDLMVAPDGENRELEAS